MKNFKYTIAFVLCLTVSVGAFAQEIKKHNFGIGVSTDIFSSSNAMNNFNPPQEFIEAIIYDAKVFGIPVTNNSSFGAFFEYQYRFDKSFSFSARLGYDYRSVDFRLAAAAYEMNGELFLGHNRHNKETSNNVFHNLNIPIFVSYTLPINEHISWTSSVGVGVSIEIFDRGHDKAKICRPESRNDEIGSLALGLYLEQWEIKPYAMVQTGLDLAIGKQRLRTTISYNLSLTDEYYYGFDGQGVPFYEFRQNSLEVGLSIFL